MTSIRTLAAALLTASLIACGATRPKTASTPSPPTADERTTDAAPPAYVTLAAGWHRKTPSVIVQPALGARVAVTAGRPKKALVPALHQYCSVLTKDGWSCDDATLVPSRKLGVFTFRRADELGRAGIRYHDDGTATMLVGTWPAKADAVARNDFDDMLLSARPR